MSAHGTDSKYAQRNTSDSALGAVSECAFGIRNKEISPPGPPSGGGLPPYAIEIHDIAIRPPVGLYQNAPLVCLNLKCSCTTCTLRFQNFSPVCICLMQTGAYTHRQAALPANQIHHSVPALNLRGTIK